MPRYQVEVFTTVIESRVFEFYADDDQAAEEEAIEMDVQASWHPNLVEVQNREARIRRKI